MATTWAEARERLHETMPELRREYDLLEQCFRNVSDQIADRRPSDIDPHETRKRPGG